MKYLGNTSTLICKNPCIVFPFVTIKNNGGNRFFEPVGTGFFIHESGLFVTAKHVPIFNKKVLIGYTDAALETFIAIHNYSNWSLFRHVKRFVYHESADICVGILHEYDAKNNFICSPDLKYDHLIPGFYIPKVDDIVENFGYGGSSVGNITEKIQTADFPCQWGRGKVEEVLLYGRDTSFLPGTTIQTNLPTMGKASGGPVFDKYGKVIGVNSTSFGLAPPTSYFTPIYKILELEFKDDDPSKTVRVSDLLETRIEDILG